MLWMGYILSVQLASESLAVLAQQLQKTSASSSRTSTSSLSSSTSTALRTARR